MNQIDPDPDLNEARQVLSLEAKALSLLIDSLGGSFKKILEVILDIQGRVIITGMGKSGHIARKIAATLSSTGTPALFVHPAEASHGDLGMITKNDVVITLSNSGETDEISAIVNYCRRFNIPLIAITSNPNSTLAKAATYVLILPKITEACPLGLAPTTSTTMMIGLGDALSVTLLKRRGFSSEDFHLFHPGGKLGHKLLRVDEIMHTEEELPVTTLATPMREALLTMTSKSFGCIGVLDKKGYLMGVITDGDLRRHMSENLLNKSTQEVMASDPITLPSKALVAEALSVMNDRRITSLFITKTSSNKHPIGIIHIHDCLRAGII